MERSGAGPEMRDRRDEGPALPPETDVCYSSKWELFPYNLKIIQRQECFEFPSHP